ncbi:ClpA/ClpB-like protein [Tamaricihabitans halophyticus]|uniref:ClpA/ClpB-like protein n=1 Tax=Tamaricihabitans halophyticus TaxID=1262583 RepID=A0A4R2Q972_9PSEU|nr:Clp protease N-terminal domain-containing protein [Tamaricihabitans halophyticus]TCP45129.1 ClpA/ClpB-like protein [Tamaricihabitans halophyticus]
MFERFSPTARAAVIGAQEIAIERDAETIEVEHLLFAMLDGADEPLRGFLAEHRIDRALIEADLRELRRRGGVSDADAAALGELGINVEQIVSSVERAHGEYVLAGARGFKRGRFRGTRAHRPFTQGAKRVLEGALREVKELGAGQIGAEHLMLALLNGEGSLVDVLGSRGLRYIDLRRDLAKLH